PQQPECHFDHGFDERSYREEFGPRPGVRLLRYRAGLQHLRYPPRLPTRQGRRYARSGEPSAYDCEWPRLGRWEELYLQPEARHRVQRRDRAQRDRGEAVDRPDDPD